MSNLDGRGIRPRETRHRQLTETDRKQKHIYKLGHIEILWSTRATEMRPSPPHRRELARRNENTVTRASSTAPRTSRGAPPHRLKTQLAAKRHSCRRRDAKRYAVPSRSNPRLRRHSLLGHRHLQLGQPGLCRGALRSGDVRRDSQQSASGERGVREWRELDLILRSSGRPSGRGEAAACGGRVPRGSEGAPGRRVSCGCSRSPP